MNDALTTGPITATERIYALDLLRGVAVLGIFFVNILFFSLPFQEALSPASMADAPTDDRLAWAFVHVFCLYKFISLFSLLFGAGLIMQMMRAQETGRPFVPLYLRRLAVLALLGLTHGLALWYGDILFVYSLIGVVVLLMRNLKPRTLITIALIGTIAAAIVGAGCASLQFLQGFDPSTIEVADPPDRGWDAIIASQFNPADPRWTTGETLAYAEGPFADAFAFRSVSMAFAVIATVFGYGWRVGGMFLIGAAMMKSGFFQGRQPQWVRRLAIGGLCIGLPLEVIAAATIWSTGFGHDGIWVAANFIHEIGSFFLCLGYVGGLTWLARYAIVRKLTFPISRAGRMALTVYLSETVIATGIMYWWGLGWFGTVNRDEMIGIVIIVYTGLVIFATIWLAIFRMGPMEWLWRCLTYLRPLPILKPARRESA